jgi:hypothetical protein
MSDINATHCIITSSKMDSTKRGMKKSLKLLMWEGEKLLVVTFQVLMAVNMKVAHLLGSCAVQIGKSLLIFQRKQARLTL